MCVLAPPVSRTASKSVSVESTPTITLPLPNADHVPKPNSVPGFVATPALV